MTNQNYSYYLMKFERLMHEIEKFKDKDIISRILIEDVVIFSDEISNGYLNIKIDINKLRTSELLSIIEKIKLIGCEVHNISGNGSPYNNNVTFNILISMEENKWKKTILLVIMH